MRKYFLLFLICCFYLPTLHAQKSNSNTQKKIPIFRAKKVKLDLIAYPWISELSFKLQGEAHPTITGCQITIDIYYQNEKVRTFMVPVLEKQDEKGRQKFLIDEQREPINFATQEVLAGKYTVKMSLQISAQPEEIRRKWNLRYGKKEAQSYSWKFKLGSASQFASQDQELKKFYIQRMKNLNTLCKELNKKKKFATVANKRKNEFSEGRKFSPKKWWRWFSTSFLPKIEQERALIQKHKKCVFFPRYNTSLKAMEGYCDLLRRLGQLLTLNLYKRHKIKQNSRIIQQLDPYAIKSIPDIIRTIQRLHADTAKELKISLVRELGYLPPPIR